MVRGWPRNMHRLSQPGLLLLCSAFPHFYFTKEKDFLTPNLPERICPGSSDWCPSVAPELSEHPECSLNSWLCKMISTDFQTWVFKNHDWSLKGFCRRWWRPTNFFLPLPGLSAPWRVYEDAEVPFKADSNPAKENCFLLLNWIQMENKWFYPGENPNVKCNQNVGSKWSFP